MSRRVLLLGPMAALTLGLVALAGCTKPAVREKPLADPLLVSKKPVEGKQHLVTPSPEPSGDDLQPPPAPPVSFLAPRR